MQHNQIRVEYMCMRQNNTALYSLSRAPNNTVQKSLAPQHPTATSFSMW